MGRRAAHAPLDVFVNGRLIGQLHKAASGAIGFDYADAWLAWEHAFPLSLSLPLTTRSHGGAAVQAVFDNLLPDAEPVLRRIAERTGADGTDSYSLLAQIGRDCVGALQFLPAGTPPDVAALQGEPLAEDDIAALLSDLHRAPLGLDRAGHFRISLAGAQEKTALLYQGGQWLRPLGTTPTTHILKPQLGRIAGEDGVIDLSSSVDNEHFCLALLRAFGLPVATTRIERFGPHRVLSVERFDRLWRPDGRLLRLPQEDCCQALGVPPGRKYQNQGGPGAVDILRLLQGSDTALQDRTAFFTAIVLFWLIGATDGHGKNVSLFLQPGGRYRLTPFYDVLSLQPAVTAGKLRRKSFALAMSFGRNRKYRVGDIAGRHCLETAEEAQLGTAATRTAVEHLLDTAGAALERARADMPRDFDASVADAIAAGMQPRLTSLAGIR